MKKMVACLALVSLVSVGFCENSVTYNGLNNGNSIINNINFRDVKSKPATHWSNEAVYKMAGLGLINGVGNGVFDPSSSVTYEQAITLVIKALGKEDEVNKSTNTTSNEYWSDKYIRYAIRNGIIDAKVVMSKNDISSSVDVSALEKTGTLVRDNSINREELAKLISKALELAETTDISFVDNSQISEDNLEYVKKVVASKIMSGDDVNMFNPKAYLTREQMAQVLDNAEELILDKLSFIKKSVIVDSKDTTAIKGTDIDGNEVIINLINRDIPVLKSGVLSGVTAINNNDEIECYINKNKEIAFIKIIEDSVSKDGVTEKLNNTIQATVVGNSPYFEEMTVRNSNNEKVVYTYGSWTEFYKDGKKVTSFDIEQGETVFIELDDIDDVVSVRAVSNNTVVFGTIVDIYNSNVTVKLDETNEYKLYNLQNIHIYKDGQEIRYTDLVKGNYLKLYQSETAIVKVEVTADKNTVENIYRGTISSINNLQDTITLKNVSTYANGKWGTEKTSFITIDLDNDVNISYYGAKIGADNLSNMQVGKEAYVVTRADSKTLEKARVIRIDTARNPIEIKDTIDTTYGNILELNEYSRDIVIDDATIIIENNKIIESFELLEDSRVYITAQRVDGDYIASVVEVMPYEEDSELGIYIGKISDIEAGKYVNVKVSAQYIDDEWDKVRKKSANFYIVEDTRIISKDGPVNISAFSLDNENIDYDGQMVCVYAKGEEIVELSVIDLANDPMIIKGNIKKINGQDITITDVDSYDHNEDDWIYDNDMTVTYGPETIIVRNGEIIKANNVQVGNDVTILKVNDVNNKVCGVIEIL